MNDWNFAGMSYANRGEYVTAVLVYWATADGANTVGFAVEYLRRGVPAQIAAEISADWSVEGIDAAAVAEFRNGAVLEILAGG